MTHEPYKLQLLSKRKRLLSRMKSTENANLSVSMRDDLAELSVLDNHPADVATELFMRGMSVGDEVRDKAYLSDIDRALQAIHDGTYGTCMACRGQIPDERLSAVPTTFYCTTCQQREESLQKQFHRPVEEDVLHPGFGAVMRDDSDETGFDGEDAWQAVERFNRRENQDEHGEQIPLDDNEGIVDDVDRFSESEYEDGLPSSPTYRP